jgi:hypothetical protein
MPSVHLKNALQQRTQCEHPFCVGGEREPKIASLSLVDPNLRHRRWWARDGEPAARPSGTVTGSHRHNHGGPATGSSAQRQLASAPGSSAGGGRVRITACRSAPPVGSATCRSAPGCRRSAPPRLAWMSPVHATARRSAQPWRPQSPHRRPEAAAIGDEGDERGSARGGGGTPWIYSGGGAWQGRQPAFVVRERKGRGGGGGYEVGARRSQEEEGKMRPLCCVCGWRGEVMGLVPFRCARPKLVNASCVWVPSVGVSLSEGLKVERCPRERLIVDPPPKHRLICTIYTSLQQTST